MKNLQKNLHLLTDKYPFLLASLALLLLGIVTYLPNTRLLGYYNDDWYLMYDGLAGGPQFFHEVFSIDRPLRGYLLELIFPWFGLNPLPYHLSAFFFRFLSGIGALWLSWQLWPSQRFRSLAIAALFLVYPGFLSQTNPIDYQAQILSLALGIFSIAFTLAAIRASKLSTKLVFTILAILLGWLCLGLVEYFAGFEVLRLAVIASYFMQQEKYRLWGWLRLTITASLPFLLAPAGFLGWRIFLFESERRATDLSVQLADLLSQPVITISYWLITLAEDFISVIFMAWTNPFLRLGFEMGIGDTARGVLFALLAVTIAGILLWARPFSESAFISRKDAISSIILAGISTVGGLLPVIVANRSVDFTNFTRYSLPAALPAVMILATLILLFRSQTVQRIVLLGLVASAVMTHHANAVAASERTRLMNNFWWQVAWRAPSIQPGTLLVASYPAGLAIEEDYFVWGPANLIYHPGSQQGNRWVETPISAATTANINIFNIHLEAQPGLSIRRGNLSNLDYTNPLIMIQNGERECVRFLDGSQPELTTNDDKKFFLIADESNLNNILVDAQPATVPEVVFGPEPARGWCNYYQKADLARQQGNWQLVSDLGREARDQGLGASAPVEWMPFLQAYAMLEDYESIEQVGRFIQRDDFLSLQACQNQATWSVSPEMSTFLQKTFCK